MAKLYFYYASMNAGKSTTLLQADFNYRERGMETMLYTAAFDDRAGSGVIASRIGLQIGGNLYDAQHRPARRGRGGAEEARAPLHPARRGAVPDPRPGRPARLDLRRARHSRARLRPQDRLPGQSVRRQRPSARARRHSGRAEGGLRLRPQGDDEPARRRRRPRGQARAPRSRSAATTATSRSAAAISWSGSPRSTGEQLRLSLTARRRGGAAIEPRKADSHILVSLGGVSSWSARSSPLSR